MARDALFSLPVADLEYGDRDLDVEIPVDWLTATLSGTEAVPRGQAGRLAVNVSKSGRNVMVRGRARAAVTMPCARTLDPVPVDLDAEVFLMLAPEAPPPAAPRQESAARRPKKKGPVPKRGARREPEAAVLEEEEAAQDTYDGEEVVLDPFVREFLLLELPMFPLREDLRSETTPAIDGPPNEPVTGGEKREAVDPRLAPLAAIASRLREKKE